MIRQCRKLINTSLGHHHIPKRAQISCISESSFSVLVNIVPYIKNMICFCSFIFNCFQSLFIFFLSSQPMLLEAKVPERVL